ncbi:diacylglycerol/lipid kinase family protein [Lichenicoccus sp.]|uniref:diacylglycerol/lipid kinase family protein n=1 Tax=Lichenicoccus sp. TaxID=2781899 RepID=UPI003D0A09EB
MLVIYNPTAGRRRVWLLWSVLDVLMAHGVRLDVVETTHAGHATGLARDAVARGATLVVAAGGDGTIAEVAEGLDARCRLGIIPLGTANVLAHELGLPGAAAEVASVLAAGRPRPLWPGIAHGPQGSRLFVQMLGIGFDAHVVHHISQPVKRALGRGAYVVHTLRELPRYGFARLQVSIDGVLHETGGVIVSKGCLYGGPYMLAPEAVPGERGFSVVLFERAGIASAMLAGAALPLNLMRLLPGMRRLRGFEIAVTTDIAVPAQSDGDPAGSTPLRVVDAPAPIEVLAGRRA